MDGYIKFQETKCRVELGWIPQELYITSEKAH